jgi:hypothetical protein
MSKHKGPTEAGSGGKLGHRSMDHRSYNSEIKQAAKKKRRRQDRPCMSGLDDEVGGEEAVEKPPPS